MSGVGRVLIVVGLLVALAGVGLVLGERVGLGRLPGDLRLGRGNVRVHVPLATSLLVSVVLTLVLNLFVRR